MGKRHLASAGFGCGGSWTSSPVTIKDQDADVFVGFTYWENFDTRKQWIADYTRAPYDRLGWRLEGLKNAATLGVESHCLLLGNETKEIIERWEELGFPEGGVKPPPPLPPGVLIPGGVL